MSCIWGKYLKPVKLGNCSANPGTLTLRPFSGLFRQQTAPVGPRYWKEKCRHLSTFPVDVYSGADAGIHGNYAGKGILISFTQTEDKQPAFTLLINRYGPGGFVNGPCF